MPDPAEMRGRASEISDPGRFGWEVLWEALKTEPSTDQAGTLTQELGLDQEREVISAYGGSRYGTEFSGVRHGRPVVLRIGVFPRIRGTAYNETHLGVSVAQFRLGVVAGLPTIEEGSSPQIEEVLAALAPEPEVWRKLEVDAGPDGIQARRPVTAHPQGYLYDLWLIERLAERLGV